MLKRDLDHYIHLRELDNRPLKDYNLQLIIERDALRAEVKRLRGLLFKGTQMERQALKETVRHE